MVQQDGQVVFSMSALLNAGNMVTVLRNVTHLCIRSIVPSDSSALTSPVNGINPIEQCGRNCTGLVTV
jgi:hypothetical protein